MNDKLQWNTVADKYEDEIFSVFRNDKDKKIEQYVKKNANKDHIAIDFGCGIGYALPLITPYFKKVIAMDVSQECLNKAMKLVSNDNVIFKQADLAGKKIDPVKADFAFCCNVAISGNNTRNYRILQNVLSSLKLNGVAVFVLPSLESSSLSSQRMVEWYQKENTKPRAIPKDELTHLDNSDGKHIMQGVFKINDILTKHYSFTELFSFFNTDKFAVEKIDRVEYDWSTEFDNPPSWLGAPYPFDWLVEVKRVK